jgi:hypothetical protein
LENREISNATATGGFDIKRPCFLSTVYLWVVYDYQNNCLLPVDAGLFLGLFYNPEDGSDIFLQNIG